MATPWRLRAYVGSVEDLLVATRLPGSVHPGYGPPENCPPGRDSELVLIGECDRGTVRLRVSDREVSVSVKPHDKPLAGESIALIALSYYSGRGTVRYLVPYCPDRVWITAGRLLPYQQAANLRSFLLFLSQLSSLSPTSLTSKIFMGTE